MLMPLSGISEEQYQAHQHYNRLLDDKGRYLPFAEFRHRIKRGEDIFLAWTLVRRARDAALQRVNFRNEAGEQAGFYITPGIAEACALVDNTTSQAALNQHAAALRGAGAELSALVLNEPITSSQLEGSNTTTLVARTMLETGRKPRTEDEHMIAGNARLMAEIPDRIKEPLTIDLIRHFHAVGMSGIDDAKYTPGTFREIDDVVIADYDGNIVHQPPKADTIPERLQIVCDFANDTGGTYIHPLIKACALHFMIAHEHPFRDGNGRTSRALFYWFMLKHGYAAFKYISISTLLHAAPVKYAHSYQNTERDSMDLTYFLEYQTSVIARAVSDYLAHIDGLVLRRAELDRVLFESGALARLTVRQVTALNILNATPHKLFSVMELSNALGVSENTARTALRALVGESLVEAVQNNEQQTLYRAG
jgi:Fic family protein